MNTHPHHDQPEPRRRELAARYFAGGSAEAEVAELDAALRDDGRFRAWFVGEARLHQALAEHFSTDEWMDGIRPLVEAPAPRRFGWAAVALAAAAVVLLAAGWWGREFMSGASADDPVARVRRAEGMRGSSPAYRDGMVLRRGHHHLGEGLIEMEFPSGVVVALEGPADFDLLQPDRMRLTHGAMAAEVPEQGVGFTVETPSGDVVDLGTSFGVRVGADGSGEAQVFKGKVDVMTGNDVQRVNASGTAVLPRSGRPEVRSGASASEFPMPSGRVLFELANGDFESMSEVGRGRPAKPGAWTGDACSVVGAGEGVVPVSGRTMVRFDATVVRGDPTGDQCVTSQIYQLIDISEAVAEAGGSPLQVELSGYFNRVAGGPQSDTRFGFIVHALDSVPAMGEAVRSVPGRSALVNTTTDADPATWERADLTVTVPKGTRWLMLEVFANEDVRNDPTGSEFDGHFMDKLELRLVSVGRGVARSGSGETSKGGEARPRFPAGDPVSPFVDPERSDSRPSR